MIVVSVDAAKWTLTEDNQISLSKSQLNTILTALRRDVCRGTVAEPEHFDYGYKLTQLQLKSNQRLQIVTSLNRIKGVALIRGWHANPG